MSNHATQLDKIEKKSDIHTEKGAYTRRNLLSKDAALAQMAQEDFTRRTLSFYKYVQISDPQTLRNQMFDALTALGCKGRIYVAREGINAQMNVPLPQWEAFDNYLQSVPEFAGVPYKIARQEMDAPSFWKLSIKLKDKIVADGISDPTFDASNTGKYMNASEVNAAIEDPDTLVVDMRNRYEAEVGYFTGAHIMQVDTFREQLATVEEDLTRNTDNAKERKVLMYCTGGIRCEKASAWLKHKGFNNVAHVKGGIIDYDRQVKEAGLENKFRGKNFVFDERLGERITDEVVSDCHLCPKYNKSDKQKSDTHYNCKSLSCNRLFLACESCHESKKGYCSTFCVHYDKLPARIKKPLARFKKKYLKNFYNPSFSKTRRI